MQYLVVSGPTSEETNFLAFFSRLTPARFAVPSIPSHRYLGVNSRAIFLITLTITVCCGSLQAKVISDMNDFKQRLGLYPVPMPFVSPTADVTAAVAGNSKL